MNTYLIFCFLKSLAIAIACVLMLIVGWLIFLVPLMWMDRKADESSMGFEWRILQLLWFSLPFAVAIFIDKCL